MPYITQERAALDLRNNLRLATEPGDWNYLYSMEYARMWRDHPRYATAHAISRTVLRPESDPGVWDLTQGLKPFVKQTDLETARIEAVTEFRRRVLSQYEDVKRSDEQNVDPYSEDNLKAKTEAK